jgi:hypothetical protein
LAIDLSPGKLRVDPASLDPGGLFAFLGDFPWIAANLVLDGVRLLGSLALLILARFTCISLPGSGVVSRGLGVRRGREHGDRGC